MRLFVASLHVHPIKSLGGFPVDHLRITDRGFEHDRRWMLVDAGDRFVSQRELPTLACLHCSPLEDGFLVTDIRNGDTIRIPWSLEEGERKSVRIWDDAVPLMIAPVDLSGWFAERLERDLRLMFMPDEARREVDHRYASGLTSLSDGYPYLIISQASLDDLNERMGTLLPMDRFRPNIVIGGGEPFQEDGWRSITIGEARFSLVKRCARCAITTTDQRTGERGVEPLRTLSAYRRRNDPEGAALVEFGMNAVALSGGHVHVQDTVRA